MKIKETKGMEATEKELFGYIDVCGVKCVPNVFCFMIQDSSKRFEIRMMILTGWWFQFFNVHTVYEVLSKFW